VSERTREIGLRKALGATRRSILFQFFLEGLMLTGFSGLIGIGGAAFIMWAIRWLVHVLSHAPMGVGIEGFDLPTMQVWSAVMAIVSLALCGIFAGLYPAAQAAKLEPVEALRRE
jgi:putative ABC transport system permease protein